MAGVKVEAELFAIIQRSQRSFRGVDVERDLGWVYFQCELDAAFLEHVQDRVPSFRQQLEAVVIHRFRRWREVVDQVPDAGAGEAVDHSDAHPLSGTRRVLHFFNRSLVHSCGVAIFPNVWRKNVFVAGIDVVQHGLADQVIRDREALQAVFLQQVALAGAIAFIGHCLVDLEMVAPASKLQAIIAHVFCQLA